MSFVEGALGTVAGEQANDKLNKSGKKGQNKYLIYGGAAIGAYLLYNWYKNRQASSSSSSTTTPASTPTQPYPYGSNYGAGGGYGGGYGGLGGGGWRSGGSGGSGGSGSSSGSGGSGSGSGGSGGSGSGSGSGGSGSGSGPGGSSGGSGGSTPAVTSPVTPAAATVSMSPVAMLTPTQAASSPSPAQLTVTGPTTSTQVAQAAQQALSNYTPGGPPAGLTINGNWVPASLAASNPSGAASGQNLLASSQPYVPPPPVNTYTPSEIAVQQSLGETGTPVTVNGVTYANAAIASQYGASPSTSTPNVSPTPTYGPTPKNNKQAQKLAANGWRG